MNTKKSAYELSTHELVHALEEAAIGVGSTASIRKNALMDQMHYLSGVVRSRLDRAEPPFMEGEQVRQKHPTHPHHGIARTIMRVLYTGHERWSLIFTNTVHSHAAEYFERVPVEQVLEEVPIRERAVA